jgi:thioredoxin-dependent peroxiredoxin
MSPTVGAPAPQFSLQNQDGQTVNLSDFKGKTVVVYFYPKALTPGCTDQACGLRDSHDALQSRNTVVLGFRPDPVAKLAKFRDKHALNFDLLSDEDHAVAEAFGVWQLKKFMGKEYMGVVRTTFIIDGKGHLAQVLETFKTKTHHETLLAALGS